MQCQSLGKGSCTKETDFCPFFEGGVCVDNCRVVNGGIRKSTLRELATDDAATNYTCTANPFKQDVSNPVVVLKQGNFTLNGCA